MDKDGLIALLDQLDWWMEWGAFLVFIGVFGEVVVEIILDWGRGSLGKILFVSFFGFLVAGGVLIEYIAGARITRYANELRELSDAEVARANVMAAEAGRIAAEADARAAQANERAEVAHLEQEKLKANNLALQKVMQPRRAFGAPPGTPHDEFMALLAKLKDAAGTPVYIQVAPDLEAETLANDIVFILRGHNWPFVFVEESLTGISPVMMAWGVEVWTWEPVECPIEMDVNSTPEARGWRAGEALADLIRLCGPMAVHFATPHLQWSSENHLAFRPPANAVVIYVGPKPVWFMMPGPVD